MAGDPAMRFKYRFWVDRGYADRNEWGRRLDCGRDGAQRAEIRHFGFPEEWFVVREDQTAAEGSLIRITADKSVWST